MAFVGLSVGAGFASGQEILQFFVVFGVPGLWGAAAVAAAMCLIGLIILQLGSYYQADGHNVVLDRVAHPITAKFMDLAVMLTIFSIGMVMFAGAGSNLNQQFGIPSWIGSVSLLVLVVVLGRFDVDKVSAVIGAITPFIIALIVAAAVYTFGHADGDRDVLDSAASTIQTTLPNALIGAGNYVGFSLMVVISMSIVIGGYYLSPRIAGIGGLLGGFTFGLLLVLSAVVLYLQVNHVKDADMPMLSLVGDIHPWLGVAMSAAIYGMIFNSALGMFYALASRLSSGKPEKFQRYFLGSVAVGFIASFLGFKTLVTYVYPILGYVGVVLMVLLFINWIRDHATITAEARSRARMRDLVRLKLDPGQRFTATDAKELGTRAEKSNIEDSALLATVHEKVSEELVADDSVEFDEETAARVLEEFQADLHDASAPGNQQAAKD